MLHQGFGQWYGLGDHLDAAIEPLLRALYETELVILHDHCAGKYFNESDPCCQRHERPYIRFVTHDRATTFSLCNEIILRSADEKIDVSCKQTASFYRGNSGDEVDDEWEIEFNPFSFTEVPLSDGTYKVFPTLTQIEAQALLRKAFEAAIAVCKYGAWNPLAGLPAE